MNKKESALVSVETSCFNKNFQVVFDDDDDQFNCNVE